MPQVKWHSGSLQQLKLANNKLESLPVWISMFTDLTTAVLDNNRLKELPKASARCCPYILIITSIAHTSLSLFLLSQALLGLPKLTIVMASSNLIKTLPENIGDYSGLQALVLQVGRFLMLLEGGDWIVK
jgi:Leucine-rich repeat (LRR) protein